MVFLVIVLLWWFIFDRFGFQFQYQFSVIFISSRIVSSYSRFFQIWLFFGFRSVFLIFCLNLLFVIVVFEYCFVLRGYQSNVKQWRRVIFVLFSFVLLGWGGENDVLVVQVVNFNLVLIQVLVYLCGVFFGIFGNLVFGLVLKGCIQWEEQMMLILCMLIVVVGFVLSVVVLVLFLGGGDSLFGGGDDCLFNVDEVIQVVFDVDWDCQ